MNERIQELSEQAQLYARQGMGKCVIELKRFDADAVSERYTKDFEEKFAELIVRECAEFIAPMGDYCGGHGEPSAPSSRECARRLKQHFGVE